MERHGRVTKMWRRKVGASAPITTTDASCLVVQQRTHGPCVPTSSLLVLWHYDERPPTKTICAFLQGATRNSSGAIFYSPRRKESFLPKYHLIVPKFHLIAPKYYFFPTWGFFISSGGIWKSPCENFQILKQSRFDSFEREVPTHEKSLASQQCA